MAPGKTSWLSEYRRLCYCIPYVESQILHKHCDEVVHISFSHNGEMFATTSKDGCVKVFGLVVNLVGLKECFCYEIIRYMSLLVICGDLHDLLFQIHLNLMPNLLVH